MHFLRVLLQEQARPLLALWTQRLAAETDQPPPRSEVLEAILEQCVILLKTGESARPGIIPNHCNLAFQHGATLDIAAHNPLLIYIVCSQSLQEFLKESVQLRQKPRLEQNRILHEMDAAFSILIHHQIQLISDPSDPLVLEEFPTHRLREAATRQPLY